MPGAVAEALRHRAVAPSPVRRALTPAGHARAVPVALVRAGGELAVIARPAGVTLAAQADTLSIWSAVAARTHIGKFRGKGHQWAKGYRPFEAAAWLERIGGVRALGACRSGAVAAHPARLAVAGAVVAVAVVGAAARTRAERAVDARPTSLARARERLVAAPVARAAVRARALLARMPSVASGTHARAIGAAAVTAAVRWARLEVALPARPARLACARTIVAVLVEGATVCAGEQRAVGAGVARVASACPVAALAAAGALVGAGGHRAVEARVARLTVARRIHWVAANGQGTCSASASCVGM